MNLIAMLLVLLASTSSCEWCGASEAPAKAGWTTTIAGPKEPGERLVVSGTITRAGKPVKDVVMYLYHTNEKGIYPKRGDETGNGRRHGYLRGWIRTDASGRYRFDTIRPAAYPGRRDPQHIHAVVKEPGRDEYSIDAYLFADDPLLTREERAKLDDRGGSGILKVARDAKGVWQGRRDITLP
jgi:protocatechuate 3,4-dioxygenase beta subunit